MQKKREEQKQQIKELIAPIRKLMPRYGTEKLHLDLKSQLKALRIKIGRDKFLQFCREQHLLVPKTKRCFITTDSKHFYYKSPNRIKDMLPTHAEQVFVCDITYLKLDDGYAYLALVTDLYSKKIMGYKLDDNMKVGMVKEALTMALKNRRYSHKKIIHHSDRGMQYCCPDYSEFAGKRGFILSTTEKYDPYENAVAERINGILKYEFGLKRIIPDMKIAAKMVNEAVRLYNGRRLHKSLQMQTPNEAHRNQNHKYATYRKNKLVA
jgi:transposase InsO family protein